MQTALRMQQEIRYFNVSIRILSPEEDYKVVKTYEKGGYYITDVRIDENTIYLSRVRPEGGAYVDASEDTIVNSEEESGAKAELHTTRQKNARHRCRYSLQRRQKKRKNCRLWFQKRSSMRDQKRCS